MEDKCTWIVLHAHPTVFAKDEDYHPEFWGVFVCPESRGEADQLLKEVLGHHKLLLSQIVSTRRALPQDDWGMNERLKAQVDEQGYGLALTKLHHSAKLED